MDACDVSGGSARAAAHIAPLSRSGGWGGTRGPRGAAARSCVEPWSWQLQWVSAASDVCRVCVAGAMLLGGEAVGKGEGRAELVSAQCGRCGRGGGSRGSGERPQQAH